MALWKDVGTRYIQETITPGEGVDTFRSPLQISAGQASDMQDFSSRQYPALRSRSGRSALFAPFGIACIQKIHITPAGVVHAIISDGLGAGSTWSYWNSTTGLWTGIEAHLPIAIGTGSWEYDLADFYDYATSTWWTFCIKLTAASQPTLTYWDGTTVNRVAYATYPFYMGPVCSYKNRLFSTPDNANGTLGYSKLGDPLTWTSPDGGIIALGSNENITVLKAMSDRLFIGTPKGLYAMFGEDEENFVMQNITTTLNIPKGNLACAYNDTVYFSDGYDIYEYNGGIVRNITRNDNTNGIIGGFAPATRTSVASTPTYRIQSMGANDHYLYVCVNQTISSVYSVWWVFDIKRRRWFIEQGNHVSDWTPYSVFATTPVGRVVASDCYESASVFYRYPRLYELESAFEYDSYNQCNFVDDPNMLDVTKWTQSYSTESIAGNYQLVGDGTNATVVVTQSTPITSSLNGYVYLGMAAAVTNANCQKFELIIQVGANETVLDTQLTPSINTWYALGGMKSITAGYVGTVIIKLVATYADAATQNGKVMLLKNALVDDVTFSYGKGEEPTVTDYESELPSSGWFFRTNTTHVSYNSPSFSWTSPKYQIRESAKKTMANLWLTIDTTNCASLDIQYTSDGTSYYSTFHESPIVTNAQRVVRAKIPISHAQKSEWIQVKVYGIGGCVITSVVFDWRIVERAR